MGLGKKGLKKSPQKALFVLKFFHPGFGNIVSNFKRQLFDVSLMFRPKNFEVGKFKKYFFWSSEKKSSQKSKVSPKNHEVFNFKMLFRAQFLCQ